MGAVGLKDIGLSQRLEYIGAVSNCAIMRSWAKQVRVFDEG